MMSLRTITLAGAAAGLFVTAILVTVALPSQLLVAGWLALAATAIGLALIGRKKHPMVPAARAGEEPLPPALRSPRPLSRRTVLLSAAALVAGAVVGRQLRPRAPIATVPPGPSGATVGPHVLRPQADGVWISPDDLALLPTRSEAFRRMEERAGEPIETDDISNQDADPRHLVEVALVASRLGDDRLRGAVRDAIGAVIGTENGRTGGHKSRNRPLGIGRNLPSYVVAADLIGLRRFDRPADDRFRSWIDGLRTKRIKDAEWTLLENEALDHSNWGAHQGAAITAVNLYLRDGSAVDTSAQILRGWLGDREGTQAWEYDPERHDYSWMCHYPDLERYLPVNPPCSRDEMEIGGIIPIDMQRGGGFRTPPRFTRYPRESLQGRTVQAELLSHAGYDVWSWGDRAVLRIAERQLAMAEYDDGWYEPEMGCYWIIAARYQARLPLTSPSEGRSIAGVEWTHRR